METLPKRLEIELTEQDVEKDLVKIVDSMNNVRQESLSRRAVTDTAAYEYIHLAYRLASILEHKSSRDEKLNNRMQSLAIMMNLDNRLKSYDPLQKDFWKKENPAFVKTLDELLISVMKDNIINLDSAYHIFNAVKHLGAEEHERDDLLRTIRPYNPPVKQKKGFFSNILNKLFRYGYASDELDELTLRIDGGQHYLPAAIEEAKARGYKFLHANAGEDAVKEIPFHSENLEGKVSLSRDDLLGKRIKKDSAGQVVLYWLVGQLPHYYAEKLENKYGKDFFKASDSTEVSIFLNGLASIVYGIYSFISLAGLPNLPDYVSFPVAGYLLIESLVRLRLVAEDNYRGVGTLPGYIIFGIPAALDSLLSHKEDSEGKRGYKFTLQNNADDYKFNYFDDLEKIILRKPRSNFRPILSAFHGMYPAGTAQDLVGDNVRTIESEDVNAYYSADNLGEYEKSFVFAGMGSSFYLLSMINEKQEQDKQSALALITSILQREESLQDRLLQIDKVFKPEYARLGHYERGKQVELIEGAN